MSDAELRRIREAFKRSASASGNLLNKNAFVNEVLCEGTPGTLADLLFASCGGTSKGINFKDLISALVLITRGTQDEKIRFEQFFSNTPSHSDNTSRVNTQNSPDKPCNKLLLQLFL